MLEFLPALPRRAPITVEFTVLGCLLALVLAFSDGVGWMSGRRPVRWLSIGYIEFFRGASLMSAAGVRRLERKLRIRH